jgi:hypothetical protein
VTRIAIGAVLVLALAAAGCGGGGSKTLSKEEYGSQLNQICTDADAQRKKLGPINGIADLASKGPGLLDALDGAISKTEKLKAPSELKADADRLISTTKQLRDLLAQVVDAAKANDLAKVQQVGTKASALTNEADSLGKTLGAPACAQG